MNECDCYDNFEKKLNGRDFLNFGWVSLGTNVGFKKIHVFSLCTILKILWNYTLLSVDPSGNAKAQT